MPRKERRKTGWVRLDMPHRIVVTGEPAAEFTDVMQMKCAGQRMVLRPNAPPAAKGAEDIQACGWWEEWSC
jgi:hypothetical protein